MVDTLIEKTKPLDMGQIEHEFQNREKIIEVGFLAEISDNQNSDATEKAMFFQLNTIRQMLLFRLRS